MRKKNVRVGFTTAQKHELWERWRRGEQMKSIGRVFGKPGGFTPVDRKRSPLALTLAEREEKLSQIVLG